MSLCAYVRAKSFQSCPVFWDPWTVAHQVEHPWDAPGKNTGVGCHVLLQGVFPTQGWKLHLLLLKHRRQILYHWATRKPSMSLHSLMSHILTYVTIFGPQMPPNIAGTTSKVKWNRTLDDDKDPCRWVICIKCTSLVRDVTSQGGCVCLEKGNIWEVFTFWSILLWT